MKEYKFLRLPLFVYVFFLALFLRLYNLGAPSIWVDEAFCVWAAKFDLPSLLRYVSADAHPPLYFILLHFWIKLFGAGEFAVRLLSVTFGMGTLVLIYSLCNEVFRNKKYGLIASLLYGVSSFSIVDIDTNVRMYAMTAFLITLSVYLLCRIIREEKPYLWIIYALTLVSALYTHYFAFFAIFAEIICIVFFYGRGGSADNNKWPGIKPAFIIGFILLLSYIPWTNQFFAQIFIFPKSGFNRGLNIFDIAQVLYFYLTPFISRINIWLVCASAILSFILLFCGIIRISKYRCGSVISLIFVTVFILPFIISLIPGQRCIFQLRTLTTIYPLFLVILSCAVMELKNKYLTYFLVAVLIVINSVFYFQYINDPGCRKQDWRTAVSCVEEEARPGDVILIQASCNVHPFNYYYKEGLLKVYVPEPELAEGIWFYKLDYNDKYRAEGGCPQYLIDNFNESFLRKIAQSCGRIIFIANAETLVDPQRKVFGWLNGNCVYSQGVRVESSYPGYSNIFIGIFKTKHQ
ncbi:MAG: glycosyltransferase family 39 protein [Armatimonadota bacterium]